MKIKFVLISLKDLYSFQIKTCVMCEYFKPEEKGSCRKTGYVHLNFAPVVYCNDFKCIIEYKKINIGIK